MIKKSFKPIISHIPDFLDYCKTKGLAKNTQRNYDRYLKKFAYWLKDISKQNIKPHELTSDDVWKYRLYLSRFPDPRTGKSLKKISQNYYLIALRALLSYFSSKDIVSLPADKIELPRYKKDGNKNQYLNLKQLNQLVSFPDIKIESGLRDRAILEVLISAGLKVNQLIKLNIDEVDNLIPQQALLWIKRYLSTRKDKNKALFINYKSRKNADKRLTARSVERITNKYGKLIGLPFSLTPEILRWSRAFALLKEETKTIKKPYAHKVFLFNQYRYLEKDNLRKEKSKTPSLPWHLIEDLINKEINWLKNNISIFSISNDKENPILNCDECIFRKLAILIVSGEIEAIEVKSKNNNLWPVKINKGNKIYHGKYWHRKMMNTILAYFKTQKYKVELEPFLNYGRADLGIYQNLTKNIYVEVGTISLYKLWYNLSTMKNTTFLIVSSEEKIIELRV